MKCFIVFFFNLLNYVTSVNIKIAVVGDVYIDLLTKESTKVEFLEITRTNGCANINSVPTRITELTEFLIDISVTNFQNSYVFFSGVPMAYVRDHVELF